VEGLSDEFDLLVGLVSWGRGCAVYPGVYSRISSGYDWIRSEVCYKSANPPSYMGCQAAERDPIYRAGNTIQPTLSPITKSPVATTISPVSSQPVSAKPVSTAPITSNPITGIPLTQFPTQYPTSRPSMEPSHAPVVETLPTSVSRSPSAGASNATRAAPVPEQQTTSNILDQNSANTSSARTSGMIYYRGLLYMSTFWSVYWFLQYR
jgi:hypothetical protein